MVFSILLFLHVCIAGIGLLAGAVALGSPKGGRFHRQAGRIFLIAMLAMTVIAFVLAVMHADRISIVPSMLTFYLVATGWRAVARRPGPTTPADLALLLLGIAAAVTGYALGWGPAHDTTSADDRGFPAAVYFIFGSIALLAACLDVSVIARRGLAGAQRLARHLWRMGLAMLIATTSFFQGQEQVFPKTLQGSLLLKLPAIAVILMMIYWLARLGATSLWKMYTRRRATA